MKKITRFNRETNRIETLFLPNDGLDGVSIKGDQGPRGADGITIVGPQGPAGKDGLSITGPKGDKGDKGDTGKDGISIVGPKGKDGKHNLIHNSKGHPKEDLGQDGDWCFNDLHEIYFKQNNKWNFFAQINSGYSKKTILGFIEAFLRAGLFFDMYFWEKVYLSKSLHLGAGSSESDSAPIKFTSSTLMTVPEPGALEYFEGHLYLTDGARHVIPTSAGVKLTTTTVSNTTNETTIYLYNFLSNELHSEERIVARIDGIYSASTNTDAFTVRFKINGVTHHSITRTAKGSVSEVGFESTYSGTIRSIGASGTFVDFAKLIDNDSVSCVGDSTIHSVDTTSGFLFEITIQWNNAKPDNSLSCTQGEICFYH